MQLRKLLLSFKMFDMEEINIQIMWKTGNIYELETLKTYSGNEFQKCSRPN